MRYLLDTCVVSDFFKGEKETLRRFQETASEEMAISDISVMEIIFGLQLKPVVKKRLSQPFQELLDRIYVCPFDTSAARESGWIRARLKTEGTPIGPYDVLIAGTALARGLILVTSNTGEFARVEGLRIEDWRSPNRL